MSQEIKPTTLWQAVFSWQNLVIVILAALTICSFSKRSAPVESNRNRCLFFWLEASMERYPAGWRLTHCEKSYEGMRAILEPFLYDMPKKDKKIWLGAVCENEAQYKEVLQYSISRTRAGGFDPPPSAPPFQGKAFYVVDYYHDHAAGLPDIDGLPTSPPGTIDFAKNWKINK